MLNTEGLRFLNLHSKVNVNYIMLIVYAIKCTQAVVIIADAVLVAVVFSFVYDDNDNIVFVVVNLNPNNCQTVGS